MDVRLIVATGRGSLSHKKLSLGDASVDLGDRAIATLFIGFVRQLLDPANAKAWNQLATQVMQGFSYVSRLGLITCSAIDVTRPAW